MTSNQTSFIVGLWK